MMIMMDVAQAEEEEEEKESYHDGWYCHAYDFAHHRSTATGTELHAKALHAEALKTWRLHMLCAAELRPSRTPIAWRLVKVWVYKGSAPI